MTQVNEIKEGSSLPTCTQALHVFSKAFRFLYVVNVFHICVHVCTHLACWQAGVRGTRAVLRTSVHVGVVVNV